MVFRYRGLAFLLLCSVALFLSGCASTTVSPSFIYSPERDKQGQDAVKAWEAVDLSSQLSVPRKNLNALLDEQLELDGEIWTAYRAALARQMAQGWTLGKWREEMNSRFKVLAGSATPDSLKTDRAALRLANGNLHSINVSRSIADLPPADCEKLKTPEGLKAAQLAAAALEDDRVRATAFATSGDAALHCRTIADIVFKGGEIGAASNLLEADDAALKADVKRAADLKEAYARAKRTYDESVFTLLGDPNNPTAKQAVAKTITKLSDLVGKVESAQGAFSSKVLTEERLASLNGFLATYKDIAAGKSVEDGNKFAIALAVFPDIRDKARKSLRDAQKPNLVPLTLQKNVELTRLEAAKRVIALREQVLAERKAQVDSLNSQVTALTAALEAFNDSSINALKDKTVIDVMNRNDDGGLETRIKLWRASTNYLDAQGRLRAETNRAYYRISALEHEKVLTYAESGINQWKSIIELSVELLAGYGAAGLKSSDLIELFKAISLLWIAVGVN